jgi:hypothetical protein
MLHVINYHSMSSFPEVMSLVLAQGPFSALRNIIDRQGLKAVTAFA